MTTYTYESLMDEREAAALPKGGGLSGFIIPPLAVIFIGAVLALFLLGAGPSNPQGVRAAPQAAQAGNAPAVSVSNVTAATQAAPAASTADGTLSPVFRPEVLYWGKQIKAWASEAGLDPNLVATVMQIESCGYQQATSGAGAMGLFQVMPYHFTSSDDPYDPATNAARGLAYLKRSLDAANGVARLAFAGYNGGISVIGNPEWTWAGQTQTYAYWGSGIYQEATNGSTVSERLQEWYKASGGGLCRKAAAAEGLNP